MLDTDTTEVSYNELPYQGSALPFTHPSHLATVASIMGLNPVPTANCRVLELGCGDGLNLLPMAASLPDATLLGIDLGAVHIESAQRTAAEVGAHNVEFQRMDVMDVDLEPGSFDYIICHGMFSWVPAPVQDRILELTRTTLSPNGMAYVSYNTLPGWHTRRMIRDMTRPHIDKDAAPPEQVRQAKAFIDSLLPALEEAADPYSQLLRKDLQKARHAPDYYFFHEHLESVNDPMYLRDFAGRSAAAGLRYVSDVALPLVLPITGDVGIAGYLAENTTDRVSRDQHMDFLTNRTFRKSLLCHEAHRPSDDPLTERVLDCWVASSGRPVQRNQDPDGYSPLEFRTHDGEQIIVDNPLIKAAFSHLTEVSPQAVRAADLVALARDALSSPARSTEADEAILVHWLLRTHRNTLGSMIHVCVDPPRHATSLPDRPVVDAATRACAVGGVPIANRRHEPVGEDPSYRALLALLDGSRDQVELAQAIDDLRAKNASADLFADETGEQASRRLLMTFLYLGLLAGDRSETTA